MPRRSPSEDVLLTSALHLHTEMSVWGSSDLIETTALITDGPKIEAHVITRALRKFRNEGWVTAEKDSDASMSPRYLYQLDDDLGVAVALAGAGRELAKGKLYPVQVIARFAGMMSLQEPTC